MPSDLEQALLDNLIIAHEDPDAAHRADVERLARLSEGWSVATTVTPPPLNPDGSIKKD